MRKVIFNNVFIAMDGAIVQAVSLANVPEMTSERF